MNHLRIYKKIVFGLLVFFSFLSNSVAQTACSTSNEVTITVVNDPSISISGAAIICTGGTATLTAVTAGGTGSCVIQWQSTSDTISGPWTNISGANATTYAPASLSVTTFYRATYSCTGLDCNLATSNIQTIRVNPGLAITVQPSNVDECVGGTNTISVTTTGGSGTISYLWEQSATGTGGWSAASGTNNTATYLPPSVTAGTRYYRVTISATGNGCPPVTSSNSTVIIRPDLVITAQPSNVDECVGGTNTISVTTTGGSGTISYLWEQSTTGTGGWSAASGTNNAVTYTPPSATAGTMYYRVTVSASGNDCQPVTSTNATVIIRPDLVITAQPVNVDECVGGTNTISVTTTGGSGTISYLWEQSTTGTGGWSAAAGTNNAATYQPPSATAGTTYYRVTVSASGNDCQPAISNNSTVIIRPDLVITAQPVNVDECVGGTNTISVTTTGGSGTISYLWEQSTTGTGGWSAATGTNNAVTYLPPSTTAGTMYYRVTVSASGNDCQPVTSNNSTVIIRPDLVITAQPINIDECTGGTNTISVTTTGGSGTITYLWEQSATGTGGWSVASGTNNAATYQPSSATAGTTYYRVTVSASGNDCQPVTSNNSTVIIRPGLTITTQPSNVDECIGGTNTISVTTSGGSGTITYLWEQSATGTGGWSAASGTNNAATYLPPSVTAGTTYYRVTISASGNGCPPITSTNSTVIIRADLAITAQPLNVAECVGGTTTISVTTTGGSGTVSYLWEQSATGTGAWSPASGTNNAATYLPPSSTAGTTYYRVTISATGNGCGSTTSTNAKVDIIDDIVITAQPQNITECIDGTLPLSITTTGGIGTTYQWEVSATGTGGWSTVSGATSASYTPPSTTAGTLYYRVIVSSASNGCGPQTSTTATVTIVPKPSVAVTTPNQIVCIGAVLTLNATPSGGTGTCTIQWQDSTDGGTNWNPISGATNNTYTTPPLGANTKYRATFSCNGNGCCN